MKNTWFYSLILLLSFGCSPKITQDMPTSIPKPDIPDVGLTREEASRLSQLALDCIGQQYPNKLGQVLGDSSYLAEPRVLHPAFYGCFDWHSAVHGHWSLVRILKAFPDIPQAGAIRAQIAENLTAENIQGEVAFFDDAHNKNYERTYGWA
ncbi:MAG: DUF2891 family protein, partial [Phaeodactylibacter sp.]|nr:DUF2891 family protein [Phaeodactylibacter sp.]